MIAPLWDVTLNSSTNSKDLSKFKIVWDKTGSRAMEDTNYEIIIPISEWPVTETPSNKSVTLAKGTDNSSSDVQSQKLGTEHTTIDDQSQLFLMSQTLTLTHLEHQKLYKRLQSDSIEPLFKKAKTEDKNLTPNPTQIKANDYTREALILNTDNDKGETSQECEPLAASRVARWWRSNQHRHAESLLAKSSPHTMLFHISRTTDCKRYLQEERKVLQRKSRKLCFRNRADIHAAIASIDDWLGNYQLALDEISKAVELDPASSTNRWLQAKLQQQYKMISLQKKRMEYINTVPRVFPTPLEVDRISASNLGVQDFIEHFLHQRKPVILLDVVKDMTTSSWNLDFVKSVAGSVKAAVKCAVPLSVEWAKLEQSREITVGEFIDQVKGGQTSDYLFDWSLPIHCPQLAKDIALPKYFSGNYLQKTLPGSLYHDSWPSLFIAPKGTVSSLHIDAFASHFWMALFQGEKRWTFFEADDTPLLYPQYFHSMDPVFSVDLSSPDAEQWPLLALTKPRQCVLQPGELLFVPAGSPHYVENLSNSVAVSANHVDQSNLKQVCEELRINALMDPRAADLLQQLEHPPFLQTCEGNSLERDQIEIENGLGHRH
ncbi:unnamed protein product [Candidula unifasciata]|uniref:JmjC domain-containing protein n=1 Tax=Candidula unifasciata TaxID=100452 RepID=A0A8S4A0L8_9EUPU|nr:unnamed protein product [Candidula unifasciata]